MIIAYIYKAHTKKGMSFIVLFKLCTAHCNTALAAHGAGKQGQIPITRIQLVYGVWLQHLYLFDCIHKSVSLGVGKFHGVPSVERFKLTELRAVIMRADYKAVRICRASVATRCISHALV